MWTDVKRKRQRKPPTALEHSGGWGYHKDAGDRALRATGVTDMTHKWNLPLTYEPKIQPVIDGICRQTIRPVKKPELKKQVGDLIRFYTWTGKPYRSKRITITEYTPIVEVKDCRISKYGIDDLRFQGETGLWDWNELDRLAEMDGIVPPTGEALRDILVVKNGIGSEWVAAQVIRW